MDDRGALSIGTRHQHNIRRHYAPVRRDFPGNKRPASRLDGGGQQGCTVNDLKMSERWRVTERGASGGRVLEKNDVTVLLTSTTFLVLNFLVVAIPSNGRLPDSRSPV